MIVSPINHRNHRITTANRVQTAASARYMDRFWNPKRSARMMTTSRNSTRPRKNRLTTGCRRYVGADNCGKSRVR